MKSLKLEFRGWDRAPACSLHEMDMIDDEGCGVCTVVVDEMRVEQNQCKLGVGLLYSDISLTGAEGGGEFVWFATKSPQHAHYCARTRRNARRGKCIVFC
jgi:hypothetical protein